MSFCKISNLAVCTRHSLVILALALNGPARSQACDPPWCNPGVGDPDTIAVSLHESFFSTIHGQEIGYKVTLPPAYNADTNAFYPLILLFPGYGSTELFGISTDWLTTAMAAGDLPWSVIVHLNAVGNSFWHDQARNTVSADTVQGYALVVDDMIPFLLNTFRISLDPATHAAVGFSMGGYGAFNVAMRSALIGSVLSVDAAIRIPGNESPAFQYSCFDDPAQITYHNLFNVLGQVGMPSVLEAVMILTSTNGVVDNLLFHQELVSAGVNSSSEFIPGLSHDMQDFVAARGPQMVAFLAQHLKVPDRGFLSVKALLQGAMVPGSGGMHALLNDLGLLPDTEPYTDLGFAHVGGGGEVANPQAMADTGMLAVTDWVIVELRDPMDPDQVSHTLSGLVRRNGLITDVDGAETLGVTIAPGSYHVAVRHRNHLGVMTATPISIKPDHMVVVDFTSPLTLLAGGSDATVPVDGARCMWAGDVNADGRVAYMGAGNDRDTILLSIGGSNSMAQVTGYHQGDLNLDGAVRYMGTQNDRDLILQSIGGNVPTAVRLHHLP
ncbi:MAG: hypothetical protein JNM31_11040 [Flavobacteriales bacterium]|nr:hypothetical protein [Flavobacteriales bacterium]